MDEQKWRPNAQLKRARELRGWSQEDVAEKIGSSQKIVSRWERGESKPVPYYRQKLCKLFRKDAAELGFVDKRHSNDDFLEIISIATSNNSGMHSTELDLGVTNKLDSAETIIDLAWEAWFASRPREAARSVNKLLPDLEKIAYLPYSSSYTLRAKNLAIRGHGLLGSVCLDALQYDTALFHYTQAHRFAEAIHDADLTSIYLCLMGDTLRQQHDLSGTLSHMENARDLASDASNAARGHILQLLAYTYGDTGQEAAFEYTIAEATDLLAFSGEGVDTAQKEFIPFEIYEIRGKINRDLGKPLNALPYLELAEKSLTSVTPRWYALLEISRAQAYCDAGDIATGIDLACKGFVKAYQCRSLHQMNRVRKLLKKLEDKSFRNHPAVRDLKNLLYETYMQMD